MARHEPIDGEIIRVTDLAVLVRDEATDSEVWVPRSVCEDGDTLGIGDDDVRVEKWFAEKEGLI